MIAIADAAVVVSDAKASAEWWKEKLGFAVHVIPGSGHGVLVGPQGERLVVHLCENFEPVSPGNTGIAFLTDEIEALVGRMTSAGVSFPGPFKKEKWGGMAKFADPDGNIFWLIGVPTTMVRATLNLRAPGSSIPRRRVKKNAPKPSRRK